MFICFLFFGVASVNAQDVETYIGQGEDLLYLKTVDGVTSAYTHFNTAPVEYQSNAVINFYLAITRILNFAVSDDSGALKDFLSQYGFEMTGTDEETLDIIAPEDENGDVVLPDESPSGETIRSFMADSFVSVIDDSIANLDTAIDNWTETDKHIIAQAYLESDADIELDYGDLYLIRAGLKYIRMNLLIAFAYDMDIDVKTFVDEMNVGLASMQDMLDNDENLLTLMYDAIEGEIGAAQLAEARTSFLEFIDDYLVASDHMRNDPAGTTSGAEEMFEIKDCDLRIEEFFRTNLEAVRDSLTGGTTYEYLDDIETWLLTGSEGESEIQVRLKNNRGAGNWTSQFGEDYVDGDVECVTIDENQYITIVLESEILELTFIGTLNETEGTITEGSYTGWVYGQTASGTFTGLRTGTTQEIRHIDFNAFFDNTYDLRDYLPEYNICNDPIAGTVGQGLGGLPEENATLGGILPDQTQEGYKLESNTNSISGTVLDINGDPIADMQVEVWSAPCGSYNGGECLGRERTNENGEYHICGLPVGSFYVKACGTCNDSYYVDKWYNDVVDCFSATAVTVTEGFDTPGIDFQLPGTRGSISGYVYEMVGEIETPVEGIRVAAINFVNVGGWCNQNFAGEGITDADGAYTIENLPEGSYFVLANASGVSGPNVQYVPEWYNNIWPEGPGSCEPTPPVDVFVDYDTQLDDFQLDRNGFISGTVTATAGGSPAANVRVTAMLVTCGNPVMVNSFDTTTDELGDYIIYMPPGGYFVKAGGASSGTNYAWEWYDGVRPVDCATLSPNVSVTLGVETPNIDFTLDPGGAISGTVVGSDGTTPANVVQVFATANPLEELWYLNQRMTYTNTSGQYTLLGLNAGDFYVQANVQGTPWAGEPYYYASEWYDDAADFSDADPVTVGAGETVTGKNFQLNSAVGSISGTVLDADTLSPVSGIQVGAHTEPCGGEYVGTAVTGADGTYTITGLPEGTCYLSTWGSDTESGTANYINEWYGGYTIAECNSAEAITVTAGDVTSGKDFYLTEGGSIWGGVYSSGGTPLNYMNVWAYSEPCGEGVFLGAANTNQYGQYLLVGMPEGPVYLQVSGSPAYVGEWYNDAYVCNNADAFTVPLGSTAINDFYLEEDSDGDGMSDQWEMDNFESLEQILIDPDGDGLINLMEFQYDTDPNESDTDEDGITDYLEIYSYHTDPNNGDTDGDGMPDGWEVQYPDELDPLVDDAGDDPDEDRYTNLEEYLKGTDPGDPLSHPVKAMPWLPLLLE